MNDDDKQQDNPEDATLLFIIIAILLMMNLSGCTTPAKKDLDCQWLLQNNGQLVEYCRLPRYDKPIGRQGL